MGVRRYDYYDIGTCVNVGCIPKKLFHYAGLLGESKEDLHAAGWGISTEATNSW
jgi:thioredoxin reductase (NADPH)